MGITAILKVAAHWDLIQVTGLLGRNTGKIKSLSTLQQDQ
jgi:hypothetical protein